MTNAIPRRAGALVSFGLVAALLVAGARPAAALGTFWDDDGSIHEPFIEAVAAAGITKGCGNGAFCPNVAVTRAQIASLLVRALGLTDANHPGFSDTVGNPHETDIKRVAAAGIVKGCGEGRYCPGSSLTRAEMATLLARAFALTPITSVDSFTDDDGIHEANIEAIAAAGITKGCAAGRYCPFGAVSRAEMATFLSRALGLKPVVPSASTVRIAPGDDVKAKLSANPAGTRFVISAGTYRLSDAYPKDNQQLIAEGTVVFTGGGSAGRALGGSATGVVIDGIVFERYANQAQTGVILTGGANWTIRNCEFRYNAGAGLAIEDGFQILDNYIHHNEQIGIVGSGNGVLVEGNEIAFNNPNDKYDMNWEAGGAKFVKTQNLVVRNNYVHDNHGAGLWTDGNNIDTTYEGNRVIGNHGPGIFHEISYRAVIRNNVVEGNAFKFYMGGILVTESSDVEVHGNTVHGNRGGIAAIQADRGSGTYGPYQVKNLWVHDNDVALSSGWNGLLSHVGAEPFSRNNRWDRNTYALGVERPFQWGGSTITWEGWRAAGQDLSGTIA